MIKGPKAPIPPLGTLTAENGVDRLERWYRSNICYLRANEQEQKPEVGFRVEKKLANLVPFPDFTFSSLHKFTIKSTFK